MNKHIQKICAVMGVAASGFFPFHAHLATIKTLSITNAPKKVITADASANWAGYAATGKDFTEVSASWKIPKVKPTKALGVDAAWVGIGGITSNDLIQSGTEEITQDGNVQYQAWTEALPATSQPLDIAVHGGDTVTVDIIEVQAGKWQIDFSNNSTGITTSKVVDYVSSHSSAEWIEEAPSDSSGILPLDNFGSVAFNGAAAIRNGKSLSITEAGAQPIMLAADDGTILAQPSVLSKAGNAFSVTRAAIAKTSSKARTRFDAIINWRHGGHGIQKRRVHT